MPGCTSENTSCSRSELGHLDVIRLDQRTVAGLHRRSLREVPILRDGLLGPVSVRRLQRCNEDADIVIKF
jgi:hypothetical protein